MERPSIYREWSAMTFPANIYDLMGEWAWLGRNFTPLCQLHPSASNCPFLGSSRAQPDSQALWTYPIGYPNDPPDHKPHGWTNQPSIGRDPDQLPETWTLRLVEISWLPAEPAEWARSSARGADLAWTEQEWIRPSSDYGTFSSLNSFLTFLWLIL